MKLLYVLGVILLLSSCKSTGVTNKITQRYISQQATIIPNAIFDSSQKDTTYCSIVFNKNGTVSIYDSIYKIEPTWGQAIEMGKHDGSLLIFILGLVLTISGIVFYIYKSQQGTKSDQDRSILGWLLIPFIGAAIAGSAFSWDKWNAEREITKQDYEQMIQINGNLDAFWSEPAKTY